MDIKIAFGRALSKIRDARQIGQEGFGEAASSSYISKLERGKYSVSIEKLDAIAAVLEVHPISLNVLTYIEMDSATTLEKVIAQVRSDFDRLNLISDIQN